MGRVCEFSKAETEYSTLLTTPIGAHAEVYTPGKHWKRAGDLLLADEYPELVEEFGNNLPGKVEAELISVTNDNAVTFGRPISPPAGMTYSAVHSIAMHNDTIIICTYCGDLWYTEDKGLSWSKCPYTLSGCNYSHQVAWLGDVPYCAYKDAAHTTFYIKRLPTSASGGAPILEHSVSVIGDAGFLTPTHCSPCKSEDDNSLFFGVYDSASSGQKTLTVVYTVDGGSTWDSLPMDVSVNSGYAAMVYHGGTLVVTAGAYPSMYRRYTTDMTTWNTPGSQSTGTTNAYITWAGDKWVTWTNGTIYTSTDLQTWEGSNSSYYTTYMSSMATSCSVSPHADSSDAGLTLFTYASDKHVYYLNHKSNPKSPDYFIDFSSLVGASGSVYSVDINDSAMLFTLNNGNNTRSFFYFDAEATRALSQCVVSVYTKNDTGDIRNILPMSDSSVGFTRKSASTSLAEIVEIHDSGEVGFTTLGCAQSGAGTIAHQNGTVLFAAGTNTVKVLSPGSTTSQSYTLSANTANITSYTETPVIRSLSASCGFFCIVLSSPAIALASKDGVTWHALPFTLPSSNFAWVSRLHNVGSLWALDYARTILQGEDVRSAEEYKAFTNDDMAVIGSGSAGFLIVNTATNQLQVTKDFVQYSSYDFSTLPLQITLATHPIAVYDESLSAWLVSGTGYLYLFNSNFSSYESLPVSSAELRSMELLNGRLYRNMMDRLEQITFSGGDFVRVPGDITSNKMVRVR